MKKISKSVSCLKKEIVLIMKSVVSHIKTEEKKNLFNKFKLKFSKKLIKLMKKKNIETKNIKHN